MARDPLDADLNYVTEVAAGTLMASDGSPVLAVSVYESPPADGRPLRTVTDETPTDGSPVTPVSYYANGVLQTPDGRPVHAVQGAVASSDTTPAAFSFVDVTDQALSTLIWSAPIDVLEIDAPATITVSGDSGAVYRINGGAATSTPGTVELNDTVEAGVTSSASNSTATSCTVTIGGVSDTFQVTTEAEAAAVFDATGGTITTPGDGYKYWTFTSSGTLTVTAEGEVEYLIVGGGGSGGFSSNNGGGGGAGGLVYSGDSAPLNLAVGSVAVTVGAGGVGGNSTASPGNNGNPSFLQVASVDLTDTLGRTMRAIAGGRGGGTAAAEAGQNGGSGGGGSAAGAGTGTNGGTGTATQGNNGGASFAGLTGVRSAGGGGGAGAVGQAGASNDAGNGGAGRTIWGSSYAGGGGGTVGSGGTAANCGVGAAGGGDGKKGENGTSATANTGSGGGGAQNGTNGTVSSGNGGSGIVILRRPV